MRQAADGWTVLFSDPGRHAFRGALFLRRVAHEVLVELHDLARDRADLAYWEQVRAEQVKAGVATDYGPGTVAAGDLVKIGGDWFKVVRANAKTVRVEVRFGIPTVPWYKVEDHRPAV